MVIRSPFNFQSQSLFCYPLLQIQLIMDQYNLPFAGDGPVQGPHVNNEDGLQAACWAIRTICYGPPFPP